MMTPTCTQQLVIVILYNPETNTIKTLDLDLNLKEEENQKLEELELNSKLI